MRGVSARYGGKLLCGQHFFTKTPATENALKRGPTVVHCPEHRHARDIPHRRLGQIYFAQDGV
jgi:hypothetical protein